MKRRQFIALIAGATVSWPLAGHAQQAKKIFKIGHIESGLPSSSPHLLAAFQQGLRKLGYVEGENTFIERRYAEGRPERLPQLAEELVQFGVDVVFAIGLPQVLAAAQATNTVPIVFVGGGDPVGAGLVKSLARPGGNVTGLTLVAVELAAKRIQILKEAVPTAMRVAVPWNPGNPINKLELNEATMAGSILGLTLLPVEIRTPDDIESAFGAMTRERADAVLLLSSPLTFPNRARLAELALKARLPTLVPLREYVEAGFLLSYGPSYAGLCRQAATYVDQILKGAKPADLPVQLPTTLQLVINLQTAKALGHTVPHSLVSRADEVIE
jgi:putative ABC transport system substrate-binding protein